jgi:1,4-alpha-glucan branching enzyme
VILDVVYNHLGPEGNYLADFGPYFTTRYRTPWGGAVNFDGPDSDEVRRFVIDNALHWISEYHLDGLRLDAVHAIFDSSSRHILDELAPRCTTSAGGSAAHARHRRERPERSAHRATAPPGRLRARRGLERGLPSRGPRRADRASIAATTSTSAA